MSEKVVIAGATGFVGSHVTNAFRKAGYQVIVISRRPPSIQWDEEQRLIKALENAALVINFAGKSVNCRFTSKNKQAILNSRIKTTRILGEAISRCYHPPGVWFNASTASIYGEFKGQPSTEKDPASGSSFLAEVARQWEQSFFSFDLPGTRRVAMRLGMVLGKNGGALKPLINLARFGLGGHQGNGRQMVSWIHLDDLFRIIVFIQSHPEFNGVVNCCAPTQVDNKSFMKAIRNAMNVPIGLPAPEWMVQIGAFILGTEAALILEDKWVEPEKLKVWGYDFNFPEPGSALEDILKK